MRWQTGRHAKNVGRHDCRDLRGGDVRGEFGVLVRAGEAACDLSGAQGAGGGDRGRGGEGVGRKDAYCVLRPGAGGVGGRAESYGVAAGGATVVVRLVLERWALTGELAQAEHSEEKTEGHQYGRARFGGCAGGGAAVNLRSRG